MFFLACKILNYMLKEINEVKTTGLKVQLDYDLNTWTQSIDDEHIDPETFKTCDISLDFSNLIFERDFSQTCKASGPPKFQLYEQFDGHGPLASGTSNLNNSITHSETPQQTNMAS